MFTLQPLSLLNRPITTALSKGQKGLTAQPPRFSSLNQETFDRVFPVFLQHTDEKQKMADGFKQMFEERAKEGWLKQRVAEVSILDLGCGNGDTSKLILEQFQKVFPDKKIFLAGLDNNPAQLAEYTEKMKSLPNVRLQTLKSDIFRSSFPEESIDLIIASHVFYHTTPDTLSKTLKNLYQSLTPGGRYTPGGVIGLSMLDPTSDFNAIQEQFGHKVTLPSESNPVTTTLTDIKQAIDTDPGLKEHTQASPYKAHVQFPVKTMNYLQTLQNAVKQPLASPDNQTVHDLLTFILHGDLAQLKQQQELQPFLGFVAAKMIKNGLSASGQAQINFNGENLFLSKPKKP